MLKIRYRAFIALSVLLFIAGCSTPTPAPTQSPLAKPVATASSPIATPTSVPQPSVLKVGKAGTATIGGRLLRINGTPIKSTTIYMTMIDIVNGTKLASIDPAIAPRAETDSNGYFAFNDLPPGEYALVVSTPSGLVMPNTAASKPVTLEVQADAVTDAGNVSIMYEFLDN
jgi:hypothetical protein